MQNDAQKSTKLENDRHAKGKPRIRTGIKAGVSHSIISPRDPQSGLPTGG